MIGINALAYVGSMGTQKSFMILTQGPLFVRMTQDHSSKSLLLNEKDRYNNERVAKRQRQKWKEREKSERERYILRDRDRNGKNRQTVGERKDKVREID